MKPFLFIGNLKMNPATQDEVKQYLMVLQREAEGQEWQSAEAVLCPSFLHIPLFKDLPLGFSLGAQHGFPEKSGAFTGEVSFSMLRDAGATHVILGHSERRTYFGETKEMVRVRVEAALKYLLTPIVCIGETKEEHQKGITEKILREELESLFQGLSKMQAEKIIIAYEPRWAIGSGVTPTTEEIQAAARFIRGFLHGILGESTAQRIRIVYGGSVKASFLSEVCWDAGMQGVLVGGESLFPYEIIKMMKQAEAHYAKSTVQK